MDTNTADLNCTKATARQQQLLKTDRLDPEIVRNLGQHQQFTEISTIEQQLDLVDSILQLNRTSPEFDTVRILADRKKDSWSLMDGLLKRYGRVVVPESLRTSLLTEAHCQIASAHPGIGKTKQIVQARYYWYKMGDDIKRFVYNCHACRRSTVLRDKTPGLLHPLPIADRPWQHISVDFKSFPKDCRGFDTIAVFVDRFSKRPISIPCHSTIDALKLARLYIIYVHKYYRPATTIVSDCRPQFVSAFWNEFNRILGTKIKLSTAFHLQTDGQTENANQYID